MSLLFYGTLATLLLFLILFTQETELTVIYFVGVVMGSLIGVYLPREEK